MSNSAPLADSKGTRAFSLSITHDHKGQTQGKIHLTSPKLIVQHVPADAIAALAAWSTHPGFGGSVTYHSQTVIDGLDVATFSQLTLN